MTYWKAEQVCLMLHVYLRIHVHRYIHSNLRSALEADKYAAPYIYSLSVSVCRLLHLT